MRSEQDKKGGGLMIGSSDEVSIVRVESGSVDVLCVDIEMRKRKMRVILTYWDVRDNDRNDRIVVCIRDIVERYEGKLMVLGDMNAHVGFLGEQELNRNGERLLGMMDECSLIMLNLDEACRGVITREEGRHKSVIDFVLVNEFLYDDFVKMDIDENKELFDLSDHCMIRIDFRFGLKGSNEGVHKNVEYYRVKDDMKERFLLKMEERLLVMNVDEQECVFHEAVTEVCDEVLKRTRVVRGNLKKNEWESVWMNDEIRREIGVRKRLNRERRNLGDGPERNEAWERYREQKRKVADMVRESIREYERKKTDEIKDNRDSGRKLWHNISLLKGVRKNGEVKVYDDRGNEMNAESLKDEMGKFWKGIYQMHENDVIDVWNDRTRERYVQNEYRDEDRVNVVYENVLEHGRGVFRIVDISVEVPWNLLEHYSMTRGRVEDVIRRKMDEVVVSSVDVRKVLKRMKVGKQPGVDGIKPEVYKWMLESEICINEMC